MFRLRSRSTLALGSLAVALAVPVAADEAATTDDHLSRMAVEHVDDQPVAGAAGGDPATDGVVAETVDYWTAEGVSGYLARPADGEPRAGILVLQEWWGLNDNIRTMARRLAAAGYAALAVDLYEGEVAEDRETAMRLARRARDDEQRLEHNLRAAHRYLREQVGTASIGTVGWCFGGGWSLRAAALFGGELDAAVVYYGRPLTDPSAIAAVEAPILGHFGSEDDGIPLDGVRQMELELAQSGVDVDLHVYDGADHAFANPSGTRYEAAAAELAWQRTLAFFALHLAGDG